MSRPRLPVPHLLRRLAVAFCSAAALAGSLAAAATGGDVFSPAASPLADLRGEAALRALGAGLPELAARHRSSVARLAGLLRRDSALRLDRAGRLYVVEARPDPATLLSPATKAGTARPPAATALGAATIAQDPALAFQLHSRPGAARTILLDFDGEDLSHTVWNPDRPQPFRVEPFTLDADPATFSAEERQRILAIWQRVAEDFSPFAVDVTTEDPGADALRRDSEADTVYGTRVQITRNSFSAGCGCAGLAYLGIFDGLPQHGLPADYLQPAMVFFDALDSLADRIADAASHEAGHNLGLLHDGDSLSDYHGPQTPTDSPLATTWAPIMGLPFGARVTQWSVGDYPTATNPEDDFAVIASHGAPAVDDEAGDTPDTAAPLEGPVAAGLVQIDRSGVIGHRDDVDVYAFAAGAGPYTLDIATAPLGANLDVEARLLDASGVEVALASPPDATAARLGGTLSGGVYRLRLDGVGARDLQTGYSDYGSAGQYRIVGQFVASGLASPTARFSVASPGGRAPVEVAFDGRASSDPDGSVVAWLWDFGDGTQGSGPQVSHRYADGGRYEVALTVRDHDGLSHRVITPLRVDAGLRRKAWVQDIALDLISAPRRGAQCEARVSVIDAFGVPVSGASVRGSWSGITRGPASGRSDASGVAVLLSNRISVNGTCAFRVTGVSAFGVAYAPERNVETSDSYTY